MPRSSDSNRASLRKMVLLGVLLAAIVSGSVMLGNRLTLESLAASEMGLRRLSSSYPLMAIGIAFVVYVGITGFSLPGATVLTLAYGWFFEVVRGVLLVSFASTTGATMAFLLSRYFFRDALQSRFDDRLAKFNDRLDASGPFYLFTLRLIPAVPFFVINAVMGLTNLKTWTFWWVSQLGMLPATVVYVYAGSSVPSLNALAVDGISAVFSPWQLARILTAFALLGVFPLLVRALVGRFGPSDVADPTAVVEHVDKRN